MNKQRFKKNNKQKGNDSRAVRSSKVKADPKKIIVHEDRSEEIRLNKYISETGLCSRREADKLIENGKVTINGIVVSMGTKVKKGDLVKVCGKSISKDEELVYIVLNKPVGITCTTEKKISGNIVDFINHEKRIFNIGRLDKDSEGLIFMTNDGDIVNKILRAGNNHEKEYVVTVDKRINNDFINKMGNGINILGKVTKKCFVSKENANTFRIILTEGMNRQIRRMCEALGYEVKKLKRIRIMNVKIDGLRTGEWRYMTSKELKGINELIKGSSKEKQ